MTWFAPYVRRRLRLVLITLLAGAIANVACLIEVRGDSPVMHLHSALRLVAPVLFLISMILGIIYLNWTLGLQLRVLQARGRLCRNCGYDLRGAPRTGGVCPECGASFTPESLNASWCAFMRVPTVVVRATRLPLVLLFSAMPFVFLPGVIRNWKPSLFVSPAVHAVERVILVFMVLAGAWMWCQWLWLRRRVRASNRCVCPFCGKNLVPDTGEAGSCPRCGEEYSRESLREAWRCFVPVSR